VLVALLLAACSSAGTGTSSAPGGSASSTPAGQGAAAGDINLGFICTCSGSLASSIEISQPTFQAWVDAANAAGGIDGRRVNLIFMDDQGNPGLSEQDLHQLVQSDHVVAIIANSQVESDWPSYLDPRKIPVFGINDPATNMAEDPLFFPEGHTQDDLPSAIAAAARKAGVTHLGMLYCAESAICQELVGPQGQAASAAGVKLVYSGSISASATSYAAECLAAEQAGATGIVVYDSIQEVELVATSCARQGYHPTFVENDGAVAQSYLGTDNLSSGLMSIQPDIPFSVTDTPATRAMTAALRTYQPSVLSSSNFSETVVQAWTAGQLFKAAAEAGEIGQGGAVSASQVLNGADSLTKETLGGLAPALTFRAGQQHTVSCWFWMRTANGKFTTPYGLTPACSSSQS
jgi:branched-chain amino acid transport system substrate-binding protein